MNKFIDMERKVILEKIQSILAEIIDNEELVLTESSKSADVDDWDSLAHFQLVMELQKEFGIKFTSVEIQGWANVGDIIDSILNKQ